MAPFKYDLQFKVLKTRFILDQQDNIDNSKTGFLIDWMINALLLFKLTDSMETPWGSIIY